MYAHDEGGICGRPLYETLTSSGWLWKAETALVLHVESLYNQPKAYSQTDQIKSHTPLCSHECHLSISETTRSHTTCALSWQAWGSCVTVVATANLQNIGKWEILCSPCLETFTWQAKNFLWGAKASHTLWSNPSSNSCLPACLSMSPSMFIILAIFLGNFMLQIFKI